MTRRAEAIPSTHGRAEPPLANSSFTIRRPGSFTTAYPRLPSSPINVDLPALEHPEMTTNRSTLLLHPPIAGEYVDSSVASERASNSSKAPLALTI
jgi:hypothetical protein